MSSERMSMARQWIEEFVTHPHPDLGRAGDVCPYMAKTLNRKLAEFIEFDAREGDDALVALLRETRASLRERAKSVGPLWMNVTSIVVPYGLPDSELMEMLARVHALLKPEFVELGLMLGEFWPGHVGGGLHNEEFRPLDSPLPMLAIRHMVLTDLAFLGGPQVDPALQLVFLSDFRRIFGEQLSKSWSQKLDAAEQAAREAMADAAETVAADV